MSHTKKMIGQRIQMMRWRLDIPQRELARLLNKSRAAIAQWESGRASPLIEDFVALARALKTTAAFLAFGDTMPKSA